MTSQALRRALIVAAAIAASMSATGCAPTVLSGLGVSPTTQATFHLSAGQKLTLAYETLDGAVAGLEVVRSTGWFGGHPGMEATAATAVRKARQILDGADAAYHASASNDPTSAIQTVQALIAAANAAAGK